MSLKAYRIRFLENLPACPIPSLRLPPSPRFPASPKALGFILWARFFWRWERPGFWRGDFCAPSQSPANPLLRRRKQRLFQHPKNKRRCTRCLRRPNSSRTLPRSPRALQKARRAPIPRAQPPLLQQGRARLPQIAPQTRARPAEKAFPRPRSPKPCSPPRARRGPVTNARCEAPKSQVASRSASASVPLDRCAAPPSPRTRWAPPKFPRACSLSFKLRHFPLQRAVVL